MIIILYVYLPCHAMIQCSFIRPKNDRGTKKNICIILFIQYIFEGQTLHHCLWADPASTAGSLKERGWEFDPIFSASQDIPTHTHSRPTPNKQTFHFQKQRNRWTVERLVHWLLRPTNNMVMSSWRFPNSVSLVELVLLGLLHQVGWDFP